MPVRVGTSEAVLESFLSQRFSSTELLRWAIGFAGDDFRAEIGSAMLPASQLAFEIAGAFHRRGLITLGLVRSLCRARPHCVSELVFVRRYVRSVANELSIATHEDDADIVHLYCWQAGNDLCGKILYERYAPRIITFFRAKACDDRLAESLTVQTFLKLRSTEEDAGARDASSALVHLYKCACTSLKDREVQRFGVTPEWGNERHRRPTSADIFGSNASVASSCLTPHHAQILALREIPIDNQVLLELIFWERLDSAMIAKILGIPEMDVLAKVTVAKQQLSLRLQEIETAAASAQRNALIATQTISRLLAALEQVSRGRT